MKRLLIVLVSLSGCAHTLRPTLVCPVSGGPKWIELTSPHFSLRTDVPEVQARSALQLYEETFAALVELSNWLLPASAPPSRTSVVLFGNARDFAELIQHKAGGLFRSDDAYGRPSIVLVNQGYYGAQRAFRHELMHRFIYQRLRRVPPWLNEGIADYFSTFAVADRKAWLGLMYDWGARMKVPESGETLMADELPRVNRLLTFGQKDFRGNASRANYQAAWALVHFLISGERDYRERFHKFMSAIAKGRRALDAFVEQYGPPEAIEPHYRAYLANLQAPDGFTKVVGVPYRRHAVEFEIEKWRLTDSEVHRLWASLQPRRARQELQLAEAHNADSAEVYRWRADIAEAHGDHDAADRQSLLAIETAPYELRYRYAWLRMRFDREERKPADERHLELLAEEMHELAGRAENSTMLNTIAWYYALVGDFQQGLPLATRATQLDPQCAECLDTLALLYFESGDVDDALVSQEAAIDRWPEGQRINPDVLERLDRYRATLGRKGDLAEGVTDGH
jgi:tetratricopeptide (TPR) repeat protein